MKRLSVLLVLAACVTQKPAADSTALLPPDTVKPAVVSLPDTVPDTTKATATMSSKTKAGSTKASTKQKAGEHLGRDSAMLIGDPRDPKRQLPTVPPKKPR